MHIMGYLGIFVAVIILFGFLGLYLTYRKITAVCQNCGHSYRPKFLKWIFAVHTADAILLTCPQCGEKCSHKIEKSN